MSEKKPDAKAPASFEDQLRELESIVEKLENEMPPLEEALGSYEHGITIAKDCLDRLDKAELRIRELKLDE